MGVAVAGNVRELRAVAELRNLASWYREFAEKAAAPWIWEARVLHAQDLSVRPIYWLTVIRRNVRPRSDTMKYPVVLITGALTGIGRAAALAFAEEAALLFPVVTRKPGKR